MKHVFSEEISLHGVAFRRGKLIMSTQIWDSPSTGTTSREYYLFVSGQRWPDRVQQRIKLDFAQNWIGPIAYAEKIDRFFVIVGGNQDWQLCTFKLRSSQDGEVTLDANSTGTVDVRESLQDYAAVSKSPPEAMAVSPGGESLWLGFEPTPKSGSILCEFGVSSGQYKAVYYKQPCNSRLLRATSISSMLSERNHLNGLSWNMDGLFLLTGALLRGNNIRFLPFNGEDVRDYLTNFGREPSEATGIADTPGTLYIVFGDSDLPKPCIAAVPKLAESN